MTPRLAPSRAKAREFLLRLINSGRRTGRYRLPAIREIARQAHVGPVTMLKAVQRLATEGQLEARPRAGTVITGGERPPDPSSVLGMRDPDAHLKAWERVYQRFQDDLLNGVYPPGTRCPVNKELCERYDTSYHSLRRAVDALLASGALERHHKSLRVPRLSSCRPGGTIVLVAHGATERNIDISFPRGATGLALFQAECSRRNVSLRVAPLEHTGRAGNTRRLRDRYDSPDVLGFAVYSTGLSQEQVDGICLDLASTGKPVGLFDDSARTLSPLRQARTVKVVRATNTQTASHLVGRYLLQLGHRAVVYVSPTHGVDWSRARLKGLRAAFAESGIGGGVVPVTCDRISGTIEVLGDGDVVRTAISQAAAALRTGGGRAGPLFAAMLQRLSGRLHLLMEDELLADIEEDLFARALGHEHATAWVASSDYVASRAKQFLLSHGVDVPRQVSVVGFDDSIEAFAHEITSYNFDLHSVARSLVGHILNPVPAPVRRPSDAITEVVGFVTERGSVARAGEG